MKLDGSKGSVAGFITMPFIQSAAVESVRYDEKAHRLETRLRAGRRVVVYEDVPQHIYDSLIFADSVAAFIRDHVEGIYPSREIH